MGSRGPKPGDAGYRPPRPIPQRIRETVTIDENGCWVWPYTTPKGYAVAFFGSRIDGTYKARPVHRVSYEAFVGPIPEGLQLDHLCRNRACCNPEHLEPVTNAENQRRAQAVRTTCRNGHPKTPENRYVFPDGKRSRCRLCRAEQKRAAA